MTANALMPLVSLGIGWLALVPIRRWVGPVAYHIAALPVGLIGWTWVAVWGGVFGQRFTWGYAAVAQVTYVLLVAGLLVLLLGARGGTRPTDTRFPLWTYLAALCSIGGFGALVARSGISFFTADSWADYEMMGLWLHDTGDVTSSVVAIRGFLIPSFHAAARMMGSDWTYAIYPVMGLLVCALVLDEVYVRSVPRIGRGWAGALSAIVTGLMASTAPFLLHSLYVHSHMVSALYLSVSLIAIGRAYFPGEVGYRVSGLDVPTARGAWLALSGLAVSGLILARPDGLAYAVVPLAMFFTLWSPGGYSTRELWTMFTASFLVPAAAYGLTIARNGLWVQEDKLNGLVVIALFVVYGLTALVLWQLPKLRSTSAWLAEDDNAARLAVSGAVLFFAAASALERQNFGLAMGYMMRNLIHRGGYNSLWVFAAGLVVLAMVFSGLRSNRMVRHALVSLALFFVAASVVHGLTHVGRASWGDSFSRVSFHVVPVVFMLLGYVGALALEGVLKSRR